ncbi:MAG: 4Fe-4S binding protein [Desulfomicrobiaceae bacterium]|nr:4Fe-4S binding protein [Desulfomicrobiaceae bacterium]
MSLHFFRLRPSPEAFRRTLQAVFALLSLGVGWRFFRFLAWALGASDQFSPRPAGVEAFLPISALLGFRRLLTTGLWDNVHPAGLTIFISALLMALLFRKGFCGYVCPVGFVSHWLAQVGRAFGISRDLPRLAERLMGVPKYVLLGFFLMTVVRMPGDQLESFLFSPYNMVSDAKLMRFFLSPSGTAVAVLALLVAASLVLRNFWCRFLCPYGALLGLVSLLSPLAVWRDEARCVSCGRCRRVCPAAIDVPKKVRVNSSLCIGCMQCIGACPVPGCLAPALFGCVGGKGLRRAEEGGGASAVACPPRRVSPLVAGLGAAGLLLLAWIWAKATGHWDAAIPQAMLRMIYMRGMAQ